MASAVDNAILSFLEAENVKYTKLTGNTKERAESILKEIGIGKETI